MKINLIEFFVKTVAENSQKTAVVDGAKTITFGELDFKARLLAYLLLSECNCQNSPVALYLPKSINAVVGDIAITYSGNTYMNLDIKNPAERISNILYLIQPKAIITNNVYYKKIRDNVSYIFWVPTIMVNIANMGLLSQVELPSLRVCWFAGEVFPTKQFNIWRHTLPQVKFCNYYGPIEITLDCVYYNIEREIPDDEPLPIGKAFRNTDILILDEGNNKIIDANKEGELCVRGTSLAMGYYNNPEKTAAAFVQNPLNHSYPETIYRTGDLVFINNHGEIVFKGRKDSLIKHMGYRIELGEIEHVIINTLKLVKNGCVVYNHQRKEITLYYEAVNELTAAEFRKAIGNALPKYMIPVVYHHLDELKRNPNGKIDRLYYSKIVE